MADFFVTCSLILLMYVSRATKNLDDKKSSYKNRVKKISRRHKTIKEIIINMAEMEINKNVDEIMTKANTLIEALPYICLLYTSRCV